MSESILKALMHLFAIIANVNKTGVTNKSRSIVESYLRLQLSKDIVTEYMELFDAYVKKYGGKTKQGDEKAYKRTSLQSVKILGICERINEELQQDYKILVLLQLLSFVSNNEEITEKEQDFLKTVSDIFNIPEKEYCNARAFSLEPNLEGIPNKEDFLIVNKEQQTPFYGFKHLHYPQLDGFVLVMFIPSINMYAFRYLGSNALLVNGHSILFNKTYMLPKGSVIRGVKIGSVYYNDIVSKFVGSMLDQQVAFTAKNVEFRFKNSKNGIQTFNFSEKGGKLIGIMGGSGVGKSTLMNVLNGNLKPQSGQIRINGLDLHKDKDKLEGVIGFVPQDDLLIEELTVYQNLYYSAKLCFNNYTDDEIKATVERVLEDLGLEQTKDLVVGNSLKKTISGGQRKRLNIALELIREPLVLFVDEPTSGLSSMDSEMVMVLLKEQTLKGKLVVVNIHQPSSDIFKMFDTLLIMDKGGYLVYSGNPIDSVIYFKTMSQHVNANEAECYNCGNINPERVLQILESKVINEYGKTTRKRKVSPKEWADLYKKNIESTKSTEEEFTELPKSKFGIPSILKQFRIFSTRNILSKLSDKQFMLISFLEAPILALILAFFTKYIEGTAENPKAYIFSANENIPIYLFMAVVVSIFIGLTVSAEEIIKDRQLLKRETFLNLSRFSYINSKIFILFIISAVQTISFVVVGNLIMELHGLTFYHWLILFSVSCVSNMLGLNISSALDSVITIYILIPFLVVPQLLFSGTMVKFDKLHRSISSYEYVPIIGDLMFSRWAYEAIAVKQFCDNKYQKNFYFLEKKKSESAYITSYLIPALKSKISKVQHSEDNNEKEKAVEVLRNEMIKLNNITPKYTFIGVDSIQTSNIDEAFINEIKEHLKLVTTYYQQKQKKATNLIDKRVAELIKELGGKEALVELKKNNHNEFLTNLVLNRMELNKIHDTGDGFVQLTDPIYKDPINKNGRAHFYSPIKKIGSLEIDTYVFNLIVLWLFALLLYVLLLTDGLRKTINLLSLMKKKS